MNLFLRFRAVVAAFSQALVSELDHLVLRCNTWAQQEHHANGTHAQISITGLTFSGETQTTVGGAGGASALPGTPTGYLQFTIGTTVYVIPYYAES